MIRLIAVAFTLTFATSVLAMSRAASSGGRHDHANPRSMRRGSCSN